MSLYQYFMLQISGEPQIWAFLLFSFYFLVRCLKYAPDNSELVYRVTWHRCQRQGLIVEWRNLLQAKNSTGHKWYSNSGPCRYHGHCFKRVKPLRHCTTQTLFKATVSLCCILNLRVCICITQTLVKCTLNLLKQLQICQLLNSTTGQYQLLVVLLKMLSQSQINPLHLRLMKPRIDSDHVSRLFNSFQIKLEIFVEYYMLTKKQSKNLIKNLIKVNLNQIKLLIFKLGYNSITDQYALLLYPLD